MQAKQWILVLACGALTACGGGGGDNSTSTGQGAGSVSFRVGDSLTYARTSTPVAPSTGTASAYLYTRYVADVSADGGFRTNLLYSNDWIAETYDQSSDLQQTSWTSGNTSCTNSPKVDGPGAVLTVGKTWDITYTRTCITSTTSNATTWNKKGVVVGAETVTTTAGSFDTYKYTETQTGRSSTGTTLVTQTCWRDKALNRTVACDWNRKFTPTGAASPTESSFETQKLSSLSVAAYSASRPMAERFAGKWLLRWTGTNSGGCDVTVSVTGNVSGGCIVNGLIRVVGDTSYDYSVTGTVDKTGALNARMSSGAAISGTFESPVKAAGNWSNTGASGTWVATHK